MAGSQPQREQIEHYTGPGGVIYSPASAHSREMAKWECEPREDGSVTKSMIDSAKRAGVHMGPKAFQVYPRVMYRFEQTAYGIKPAEHLTAHSEVEQRNLESRGFATTQEAAFKAVEDANFALAEAAANRAFHDRRMSEQAQAEADAVDSRVARHLGEIPAMPLAPKREKVILTDDPPAAKRGRPRTTPVEPVGA